MVVRMKPDIRPPAIINHETGDINVPGKGPLPLIGPTSGAAYEDLKQREKAVNQQLRDLRHSLLSTFQCTQCKEKQPGTLIRLKWMVVEGMKMLAPVCRHVNCDAPAVIIEDARDLRKQPARVQ